MTHSSILVHQPLQQLLRMRKDIFLSVNSVTMPTLHTLCDEMYNFIAPTWVRRTPRAVSFGSHSAPLGSLLSWVFVWLPSETRGLSLASWSIHGVFGNCAAVCCVFLAAAGHCSITRG